MLIRSIPRKSKLSMLKGCQGPYISIQIWVRGHYLKLEIKLESINSITRTSTHFTGQDKGRLTIKESGTQKLCTLIAHFHRNLIPLQMNQSLKVRKKRTSRYLKSTSTLYWTWWCLITPSHSRTTPSSLIKTNIQEVRMWLKLPQFHLRRINRLHYRSKTATSYLAFQPQHRKLQELALQIKARISKSLWEQPYWINSQSSSL